MSAVEIYADDPLVALTARARAEMKLTSYPDKPWVLPSAGQAARIAAGRAVLDCAIVGGGQFGLVTAFGLARENVTSVRVFDANPPDRAGPWMTWARMDMLRTPKDLGGHELGVPSLSFRAWYEAQHGTAGWERMSRIPRPVWMDYLNWFRDATGVVVESESRLMRIVPLEDGLLELTLECAGSSHSVLTRTVVLATGAEGSGGHVIPAFIREALPPRLHAHTNGPIDFNSLRGKRVGVLGAGASAFDNAATALEAGAAEAHLCFRRDRLPVANPRRWMENSGFLAHYAALPDADKWAYMKRLYDMSQPPPEPTFRRATALPGFHMHPATPWLSVRPVQDSGGEYVEVDTPGGSLRFDFVIAATGLTVNLGLRPELSEIASHAALWGDRYVPPDELRDERLARFPYLGPNCEFTEKTPGSAPWLGRIFTITRGATLSMGPSAASNSNIKYTAPRIVAGVARRLFFDQREATWNAFMAADHDELRGEAMSAVARGRS